MRSSSITPTDQTSALGHGVFSSPTSGALYFWFPILLHDEMQSKSFEAPKSATFKMKLVSEENPERSFSRRFNYFQKELSLLRSTRMLSGLISLWKILFFSIEYRALMSWVLIFFKISTLSQKLHNLSTLRLSSFSVTPQFRSIKIIQSRSLGL